MARILVRECPPTRVLASSIIGAWHRSRAGERTLGAQWYAEAHGHASLIGELVGLDVYAGAGALAVLSPQNEWTVNIREAYDIATLTAAGVLPEDGGYSAFPINVAKSWDILSGSLTADQVVSGPKVRPFWRAIAGLPGGPVIDRHATRIATDYTHDGVTDASSLLISAGYELAASILARDVHAVQATTWLVCKRELAAQTGARP